jgi:hypothetical protein
MRVELTAAHIPTGSQGDLLRVIALWWMAHEGRHRVLLAAADREPWLAWIQKQEPLLKEAIEGALAASEAADAYGPALSPTVVVGFQQPWVGERLGLSLIDALEVLSQPLRVLVENAVHDSNFLLSYASPITRETLRRWEAQGWLRFEHCGGKDHLAKEVQRSCEAAAGWSPRLFFVVDSDRTIPPAVDGSPAPLAGRQKEVEELQLKCANQQGVEPLLLGAILRRREAENYAPFNLVADWLIKDDYHRRLLADWQSLDEQAKSKLFPELAGSSSTFRRAVLLNTLKGLSEGLIEVYDMKKGIDKSSFGAQLAPEAQAYL